MKKIVNYALGDEIQRSREFDMENYDVRNYDRMVNEADEKIRALNPSYEGDVKIFGFNSEEHE